MCYTCYIDCYTHYIDNLKSKIITFKHIIFQWNINCFSAYLFLYQIKHFYCTKTIQINIMTESICQVNTCHRAKSKMTDFTWRTFYASLYFISYQSLSPKMTATSFWLSYGARHSPIILNKFDMWRGLHWLCVTDARFSLIAYEFL